MAEPITVIAFPDAAVGGADKDALTDGVWANTADTGIAAVPLATND